MSTSVTSDHKLPTSLLQNTKLGAVPHQERGKQSLQMHVLQGCLLHKYLTAVAVLIA